MLLPYKPLHLEAQQRLQEEGCIVDIKLFSGARVRSAPDWYGNPVLEVMLLDHDEPMNYKKAMMSPDSAKWFEAMKSEI